MSLAQGSREGSFGPYPLDDTDAMGSLKLYRDTLRVRCWGTALPGFWERSSRGTLVMRARDPVPSPSVLGSTSFYIPFLSLMFVIKVLHIQLYATKLKIFRDIFYVVYVRTYA